MTEAERAGETKRAHAQERLRPVLGRLALSVAGGAALAAPLAVTMGLTQAEVKDETGPLPATISAAPGHSSLETGFAGALYNDGDSFHRFGVGVNVRLEGLPQDTGALASGDVRAFTRPFVGLHQQPKETISTYTEALQDEILRISRSGELRFGALASTLLFLSTVGAGRLELRRRLAVTGGGLTAMSVIMSGTLYQLWLDNNRIPEQTYSIASIPESSPFSGTVANSAATAVAVQGITPYIERETERLERANNNFEATTRYSFDSEMSQNAFVPPKEGETTVLVLSDLHSNHNMIEAYTYAVERINEQYGAGTLEIALFPGDLTYGSVSENSAVQKMAKIADRPFAILGNHDGEQTEKALRDAKVQLLDGKTVSLTDDLTILGDEDPTLTKISALFGFGENMMRHKDSPSQTELGEHYLKEAEKTKPTFVMGHEGYQFGPFIRLESVTKSEVDAWFENAPDAPSHLLPASVIMWGHWHEKMRYRAVPSINGGEGLAINLGTAGGASAAMSFSEMSLPFTPPAVRASALFITIDNETTLPVRLQELTTETDGLMRLHTPEEFNQDRIAAQESKDRGSVRKERSGRALSMQDRPKP